MKNLSKKLDATLYWKLEWKLIEALNAKMREKLYWALREELGDKLSEKLRGTTNLLKETT